MTQPKIQTGVVHDMPDDIEAGPVVRIAAKAPKNGFASLMVCVLG